MDMNQANSNLVVALSRNVSIVVDCMNRLDAIVHQLNNQGETQNGVSPLLKSLMSVIADLDELHDDNLIAIIKNCNDEELNIIYKLIEEKRQAC